MKELAMSMVTIREPMLEDEDTLIAAIKQSHDLHHPWINPPKNHQEFVDYFQRYQQSNQKSFLVCDLVGNITGVFNVNEIIHGLFQSAYLGFYAVERYAQQGYMSAGLKLVLEKIFIEMELHRIEANIQPGNISSLALVKNNNFCKEGYSPRYLRINGEWQDHERWAITYEDWLEFKND